MMIAGRALYCASNIGRAVVDHNMVRNVKFFEAIQKIKY